MSKIKIDNVLPFNPSARRVAQQLCKNMKGNKTQGEMDRIIKDCIRFDRSQIPSSCWSPAILPSHFSPSLTSINRTDVPTWDLLCKLYKNVRESQLHTEFSNNISLNSVRDQTYKTRDLRTKFGCSLLCFAASMYDTYLNKKGEECSTAVYLHDCLYVNAAQAVDWNKDNMFKEFLRDVDYLFIDNYDDHYAFLTNQYYLTTIRDLLLYRSQCFNKITIISVDNYSNRRKQTQVGLSAFMKQNTKGGVGAESLGNLPSISSSVVEIVDHTFKNINFRTKE